MTPESITYLTGGCLAQYVSWAADTTVLIVAIALLFFAHRVASALAECCIKEIETKEARPCDTKISQ